MTLAQGVIRLFTLAMCIFGMWGLVVTIVEMVKKERK